MNTRHTTASLLLALTLIAPAVARSEVVTLRDGVDGYAGTRDTGIYNRRDHNYGASTALFIGNQGDGHDQRILLYFDLSAYAGRTVVGDVTLSLLQAPSTFVGTFSIGVFQISVANAGWIEGAGNGTSATTGEPNWAYSSAGDAVAWAGSGGLSTPGVDYVGAQLGTLVYDTALGFSTVTVTISSTVVQGWIDNPGSNAGLLLMRTDTDPVAAFGRYRTSEEATISARPALTFELASIPEPATQAAWAGGMALAGVACMRRRYARR